MRTPTAETGTVSGVDGLERFIDQTMPAILRSKTAPDGFSGTTGMWEEVRQEALFYHRAKAAYDFALRLAAGWTSEELARGELDRGASVTSGGRVVRPPEPQIDAALEQEASLALSGLSRYGVTISQVLMSALEQAAGRRWFGPARPVEDAISAATAAVRQAMAELQAARVVEDDKITLRVRQSFRAVGGVEYTTGVHRITEEAANDLRDWAQRMEATAKQRRWAAPLGFEPDTWPPFAIGDTAITTP